MELQVSPVNSKFENFVREYQRSAREQIEIAAAVAIANTTSDKDSKLLTTTQTVQALQCQRSYLVYEALSEFERRDNLNDEYIAPLMIELEVCVCINLKVGKTKFNNPKPP